MPSRYLFALKNYRAALIAALFFGCITPGAKFLIRDFPPQSLAGLLYIFAGIGLFIILLFQRNIVNSFSRIQKVDLKWFFLATLFGGIMGPAFLTYGISHIRGSTASLLLNLEAVLTSLIAWFIFKEHFEKKIVFGMILIVLGCLSLSFNSNVSTGTDTLTGFILICCACLSWGIDNNVTRKISHLDPVLIACFKGLIAGSTNLYLGYLIGEKLSWNFGILQIGILGFFGIGISLVAFIISLGMIGTARTGAIFSTAPFIGSLLSILFLSETITMPFVIALLLMAGGVWCHLSENHNQMHTHEELNHEHEHIHDEHHQHSHSANDPVSEPHTHPHHHKRMTHKHPHFPDIHHQHEHH
jgi:drug/metabolite transporter (DMT)-like permease